MILSQSFLPLSGIPRRTTAQACRRQATKNICNIIEVKVVLLPLATTYYQRECTDRRQGWAEAQCLCLGEVITI